MTVQDAAIQILLSAGKPLHTKEIAKSIIEAGLWQSGGKTPEATVSARLYSDIKKNIALCPLCAAKYEVFVKTDDEVMAELKKAFFSAENCEVQILLGDQKTSIRFVETHYHDLKMIFEGLG